MTRLENVKKEEEYMLSIETPIYKVINVELYSQEEHQLLRKT